MLEDLSVDTDDVMEMVMRRRDLDSYIDDHRWAPKSRKKKVSR